MVKCQRSGCGNKATYAIQMMESVSIWPGVCRSCAIEHVNTVGGDINNKAYAIPIWEAEWYPRRISKKQREVMLNLVRKQRQRQAKDQTANGVGGVVNE